ncbi:MAG: hypothetical protein KJ052_11470 [Candidatus Hydrogenedentes bacterium]|nr:hypothetical protein [Candidatus Hydrogenedentota bacterium]
MQTIAARVQPAVGRTFVALTIGRGKEEYAALSEVTAVLVPTPQETPICVEGTAALDETSLRHSLRVLAPLLQDTAASLGLGRPCFSVSVCNLNAASVQDREISIHGFSADTAIFVACLSALLGVPALPGVVATGHIASKAGAIRAVGGLAAKLSAASAHAEIHTVVYPDPESDDSFKTIAPEEQLRAMEAVIAGRDRLQLTPIRTVDDLIRATFSEGDLIRAALENDYFPDDAAGETADAAPPALRANLSERFWDYLARRLRGTELFRDHELLSARVRFSHSHGKYPAGFGAKLYQALASIPRNMRDLRLTFPLLSAEHTFMLVQLVSPADLPDLRRLLDAIAGDHFLVQPFLPAVSLDTGNEVLSVLLQEIDLNALAKKIGAPFDEARASFVLDRVTVETREEFVDVLTAFSHHVFNHVGTLSSDRDSDGLASDTFDALEKALARQGGMKSAFAEACSASHGGLRFVLDLLTDQFKNDAVSKHVTLTMNKTLQLLGYDERVAMVRALLDLLGPGLPDEFVSAPPEQFVQQVEPLIRAYVQSIDMIRRHVRAL